ncbi:hybrid sensor histidine kinase/response regulator [Scleromatobacter humisilvae]|uniref:histidine kinase n=1 Tax=Scleromatobacter humisilvae TaxID=2897159 RepID=A0A9X1YLA1_9BURK|nr:response regulator [Scleromatobacter humisilvae]MCK9688394.1 response regulator [Scleromatobacter humisilvae]
MTDAKPEFRPIDRSEHELLIIDDNPATRYATARQLRSAGFRTREAATGADGLAAADNSISAVVLDVHLPDIDGFDLCAMLRSRPGTARLPVLHLTAAYVTDEDKVRGLDSGADAYLTRPVEPAVLVATVQALVRTRVAEEAMRRSESKFRAIYAQAQAGIALLDDQGRLVDANPAMLKMMARGDGEVIGHALSEFAPREWAHKIVSSSVAADAPSSSLELPMQRPDGSLIYVEWSFSPHIEPGVTMAIATDVSQRVALEHQRQQLLDRERIARSEAEQVSRMKDDFIAVLSHELRTPLNAIMSWTHVLRQRGGSAETMRGLAAIERNGTTQARMISDLLDMSRLNLGKLPLTFVTIDPVDEIVASVNAMRPADGGGPVIDVQASPPYRPIRVDASRLQQVIWNLLSNAIKFSPPGGRIVVALEQDERGLRIRVADEGQGIAPEFLPFVFDRFAQSDAASNRQRGGLGLGLSIVKQLVEAHGGTVSAASAGVGRGATFEVWLPADPVHADNPDYPDSSHGSEALDMSPASLDGVQLLVVDDDPEASAMLRIILSDRGAVVHMAHDVSSALQLLSARAFDALISDIGMAGQDGYDLIREVRHQEATQPTRRPRLPAIALTSFTRTQDRDQALAAGFDLHCGKPLRPLNLLQQIRSLLDLRH